MLTKASCSTCFNYYWFGKVHSKNIVGPPVAHLTMKRGVSIGQVMTLWVDRMSLDL
jgi:hypothetical protein